VTDTPYRQSRNGVCAVAFENRNGASVGWERKIQEAARGFICGDFYDDELFDRFRQSVREYALLGRE